HVAAVAKMTDDRLQILRNARSIGYVFSGGSARCAFQVGVVETLRELDIQPSLCIGVSGGVWNAASVSAQTDERLRYYWRSFARSPHVDLKNLLRADHSPFLYSKLHERHFERYVGTARLLDDSVRMFVNVTRLRDRAPQLYDVRDVEDPFALLLASNYLPPFYTHAPLVEGERFGDGGTTDNAPYEEAFERGCDAVVIMALKGETEGNLYRSIDDTEHQISPEYRDRVVVIRPRHRVPVSFVERRWDVLERLIELGGLRAREVLLGERHPETEWRAKGEAISVKLARMFGRSGVPGGKNPRPVSD
ncbi:MAG: patatin-like phospholipase family protein, partial [Thermoanaerobaculia bacterium]|nr:patatin-like phospholipase family protein [Thermoanaerobaculia bacterium]